MAQMTLIPVPLAAPLSERVKARGRRGVREARAVLAAHRPLDEQSMRSHAAAGRALARATSRGARP